MVCFSRKQSVTFIPLIYFFFSWFMICCQFYFCSISLFLWSCWNCRSSKCPFCPEFFIPKFRCRNWCDSSSCQAFVIKPVSKVKTCSCDICRQDCTNSINVRIHISAVYCSIVSIKCHSVFIRCPLCDCCLVFCIFPICCGCDFCCTNKPTRKCVACFCWSWKTSNCLIIYNWFCLCVWCSTISIKCQYVSIRCPMRCVNPVSGWTLWDYNIFIIIPRQACSTPPSKCVACFWNVSRCWQI